MTIWPSQKHAHHRNSSPTKPETSDPGRTFIKLKSEQVRSGPTNEELTNIHKSWSRIPHVYWRKSISSRINHLSLHTLLPWQCPTRVRPESDQDRTAILHEQINVKDQQIEKLQQALDQQQQLHAICQNTVEAQRLQLEEARRPQPLLARLKAVFAPE